MSLRMMRRCAPRFFSLSTCLRRSMALPTSSYFYYFLDGLFVQKKSCYRYIISVGNKCVASCCMLYDLWQLTTNISQSYQISKNEELLSIHTTPKHCHRQKMGLFQSITSTQTTFSPLNNPPPLMHWNLHDQPNKLSICS